MNDIYCDKIQYNSYKSKKLSTAFLTLDAKVDVTDFLKKPNQESANKYINSCFERRSKSMVLNRDAMRIIDGNYENRSVHMVVAFLLGCYIQSKMNDVFCSNIGKGEWSFEYIWFMCCLYHDTFSFVEDEKHIEITSIDDILPKIAGEEQRYTIYDSEIIGVELPIPTYPKEDIERYFAHRLSCEDRRIDHGIVGGYASFQKLIENFLNKQAEKGGADSFYTFDDKNQPLRWDKKQVEAFAYAADAIIAHNIWHSSNIQEYEEYGLQDLIVGSPSEIKLNIKKSPLSYLLSLVDTIEPVKQFAECGDEEAVKQVLENITIAIGSKHFAIGQSKKHLYDFEKWYNDKIKNMPDWMEGIETAYSKQTNTICIEMMS